VKGKGKGIKGVEIKKGVKQVLSLYIAENLTELLNHYILQ